MRFAFCDKKNQFSWRVIRWLVIYLNLLKLFLFMFIVQLCKNTSKSHNWLHAEGVKSNHALLIAGI